MAEDIDFLSCRSYERSLITSGGDGATAIQTVDFIKIVRKYRSLWDSTCPEYKTPKKMHIWAEVCEKVVPGFNTFDKAKKYSTIVRFIKKWSSVRDAYRKSRKNLLQKKTAKPYVYSDVLSFLNPVLKFNDFTHDGNDETNCTNEGKSDTEEYLNEVVYLESEEDEPNFNNDYKNTQEVFISSDGIDRDVDDSPSIIKLATSQDRQQNTSFSNDDNTTTIRNLIEREEDDDRAFFNSIMPMVKRLRANDKIDFRIKVLTVLKELSIKKERDPVGDDDF